MQQDGQLPRYKDFLQHRKHKMLFDNGINTVAGESKKEEKNESKKMNY